MFGQFYTSTDIQNVNLFTILSMNVSISNCLILLHELYLVNHVPLPCKLRKTKLAKHSGKTFHLTNKMATLGQESQPIKTFLPKTFLDHFKDKLNQISFQKHAHVIY